MTTYRTPLAPLTNDQTTGEARDRLAATEARMGLVPNMYRTMANSPGLLATYLDGYERFRSGSGFSPAEQEIVFLTVSRHFECHYCMAAHSFLADKVSHAPAEAVAAIREDRPVDDPRLAALVGLTRALLETQGHPDDDAVETFRAAGFSDEQVLELILAIAVKTISNWSNHLFDTEVDEMFAGHSWTAPQHV